MLRDDSAGRENARYLYVYGNCQSMVHIAIYEPLHDKTNKMARAPSEDSGQPGQSLHCPHEESLGP